MPTNTPVHILHAMQDLVDASPRGRKGLADDLGVSREVISYRLNGLQNWPLTDHSRVARYLGFPRGAQWLQLVCGDGYGVYRRRPGQASAADILSIEADEIGAEGELLAAVKQALADKRLTKDEVDHIVDHAHELESLIEELKSAVLRSSLNDGEEGGR